jgi:hypothetical protein
MECSCRVRRNAEACISAVRAAFEFDVGAVLERDRAMHSYHDK